MIPSVNSFVYGIAFRRMELQFLFYARNETAGANNGFYNLVSGCLVVLAFSSGKYFEGRLCIFFLHLLGDLQTILLLKEMAVTWWKNLSFGK